MKISVGIDLSINSTGISIILNNIPIKYYIITSKSTKYIKNFKNEYIEYILYAKNDILQTDIYNIRELKKTQNLITIVNIIKYIFTDKLYKDISKYLKYNIDEDFFKNNTFKVFIEGVSYGSSVTNALSDLSGLNYLVRNMLILLNIEYEIITPMSNKKFAIGIGNADKDLMVNAWLHCQPKYILDSIKAENNIKLDDVADAYFLAAHFKDF